MATPEARARQNIDAQLTACGWVVQDRAGMNLYAGQGVAVREFPLETGYADYLLFVDRKAAGVLEAKAEGVPLSTVSEQAGEYAVGLPANIPHLELPLPFLYESTGVETFFRDNRDPQPRSRRVFAFHRPETLADWLSQPDTLRARLQGMAEKFPLISDSLWPAQVEAIHNLERSFASDRPRALIQMATGSSKTFTAVNFVYRLVKHARARRVLFLVDRNNLGRQTFKEFDQFVTPDDGRKFSELYNVQHLQSNLVDDVSKVHITTIQRLYSMLCGEADFDPANEEVSLWEAEGTLAGQAEKEVRYNARVPPEYYDFIITDECHRSIYNLWRQALEYFDAYLIGLTATPSKQTFGFFNQNLVMEYPHQRAVADGVNVAGEVYRIRTRITEQGSTIEKGWWVGRRDRGTRRQRWEQLDEDFSYDPNELDRLVTSPIETLRKHEIFAGDLVIAALGDTLPRACIIPEFVGPAVVKADCMRYCSHSKIANSKYLNFALNSEVTKRQAAKIIHGIGRPRLNQSEVKSLPIPLPPIDEQYYIVTEVERRLSVIQEMEQSVSANLKRTARLRQAILKRAFEGRLVEQRPNDQKIEDWMDKKGENNGRK
jgi:type I restriction enzyme R subunit